MDNIHRGHRKRVKEEFLQVGMSHFPDHRSLELLLFFSIPREDTNEIAHRLLDRFGSVAGVFDADRELLMEVEGIGPESATHIKVVASMFRRYADDRAAAKNRITTAEDAKEYMQYKFFGETRECIYIACLSDNGRVVFCKKIAEGNAETVSMNPRDIVKLVFQANAARLIMAHNHPDGVCVPSRQDLQTTRILHGQFKQLGVELFDHIIVTDDAAYSMSEHDLLPENH